MNPLNNINSIYLSITEISESLPSVSSTTLQDSNELTKQLEHLSLHNYGTPAAASATMFNGIASTASAANNGFSGDAAAARINTNGGSDEKRYLQDDGSFNIINNNSNINDQFYYSTTSVKEMSNCSASCSHSSNAGAIGSVHDVPRSSKRFRPHHLSRRLESTIPRKSLDASSIRKKTPAKPRPRATSFGALQLAQGKFGAVCRKMFGQQRSNRRKSFSISSKSSSIDADINDLTIASTDAGGQATTSESQSSNISQNQRGCGHEAASSPPGDLTNYPTIENGEIDELAEYFEHFVSVHRKMSALAESMYV